MCRTGVISVAQWCARIRPTAQSCGRHQMSPCWGPYTCFTVTACWRNWQPVTRTLTFFLKVDHDSMHAHAHQSFSIDRGRQFKALARVCKRTAGQTQAARHVGPSVLNSNVSRIACWLIILKVNKTLHADPAECQARECAPALRKMKTTRAAHFFSNWRSRHFLPHFL